jgi:hypothetical protein
MVVDITNTILIFADERLSLIFSICAMNDTLKMREADNNNIMLVIFLSFVPM